MDGGEHVGSVGDSVGPSDVDADAALRRLKEDIDHNVAHDDGSIGKTFLGQVTGGDFGGRQEQISGMVGENPVCSSAFAD